MRAKTSDDISRLSTVSVLYLHRLAGLATYKRLQLILRCRLVSSRFGRRHLSTHQPNRASEHQHLTR